MPYLNAALQLLAGTLFLATLLRPQPILALDLAALVRDVEQSAGFFIKWFF